MKYKKSFITNSSSTSYLISIDKTNDLKVRINIEIDLVDFLHRVILNQKELDNFLSEHSINLVDTVELVEELKNGKKILLLNFSSEDGDYLERYISTHGDIFNDLLKIPSLKLINSWRE